MKKFTKKEEFFSDFCLFFRKNHANLEKSIVYTNNDIFSMWVHGHFRFLGNTSTENMLESLKWSKLVVSRLCLDKNIEDPNADEMSTAENDLQ